MLSKEEAEYAELEDSIAHEHREDYRQERSDKKGWTNDDWAIDKGVIPPGYEENQTEG